MSGTGALVLIEIEALAPGDATLSFDEQIDRDLVVAILRGRRLMADWQVWRRQPDGAWRISVDMWNPGEPAAGGVGVSTTPEAPGTPADSAI